MSTLLILALASPPPIAAFGWIIGTRRYQAHRNYLLWERMVFLRTDLLELVAAGVIDPTHPIYQLLRSTFAGYMDRPDWFGWATLLAARGEERDDRRSFAELVRKARESLTHEQRARLDPLLTRLDRCVREHLLLGSPFLSFTFLPYLVAFMLRRDRSRIARYLLRENGAVARWTDWCNTVALRYGLAALME